MLQHARNIVQSNREVPTSPQITRQPPIQVPTDTKRLLIQLQSPPGITMLQHARNIDQSNREVPTSLAILRPDLNQVAGDGEGSLVALSGLRRVGVLERVAQQRMNEETGLGAGA